MAYEIPGLKYGTLLAGEDLSSAQFLFGKVNSAGKIVKCSVSGEDSDGVIYGKPVSGVAVEMCGSRIAKVIAGSAIAAGAKVTTNASGKASTAASGDYYLGKALESVNADGEVITVLLKFNGKI